MKRSTLFMMWISILLLLVLFSCNNVKKGSPGITDESDKETRDSDSETTSSVGEEEVFKYFAIGNSITKHQKCDYWWNEIGMAASAAENDYVHLVTAGLKEKYKNVQAEAYNFSVWEITASKERSQTFSILDPMLAEDLNLITIQLSENAATTLSGIENDFVRLVRYIQGKCPDARILLIDDYYYAERGALKKSAADRCGLTFVSLEEIRGKSEYNCGMNTVVYGDDGSEHTVTHAGVAGHPGDKGMEAIADSVLAAYETVPPAATDPNDELLNDPDDDNPQPVGENIIGNSGFENGGEGWIEFGDTPVKTADDIVHSGEKSLLLDSTHAKYTTWIPVKKGETYKISAWVYGKATLASAMIKSDGSIEYSYHAEGGVAGEWTYLEGYLSIGDNITQIDVTILKTDSGNVYADDVFIGAVGGKQNGSEDAYRYLAIGNSITVQPVCDYWWSNSGMGASSPEKDYFHRVMAGLKGIHGEVTGNVYNFSVWEVTSADRVQTLQILDSRLEEDLDLITVQLSEYCDDLVTFQSDFEYMIRHIQGKCPHAKILILDDFWYEDRGEIKKTVAESRGVSFVSLRDIRGNEEYLCGMNTSVTGSDGEQHTVKTENTAKHPGDKGMQVIAEALLAALK